jgi:hypothetical protein
MIHSLCIGCLYSIDEYKYTKLAVWVAEKTQTKFLDHSWLDTAARYSQPSEDDLAEAAERLGGWKIGKAANLDSTKPGAEIHPVPVLVAPERPGSDLVSRHMPRNWVLTLERTDCSALTSGRVGILTHAVAGVDITIECFVCALYNRGVMAVVLTE